MAKRNHGVIWCTYYGGIWQTEQDKNLQSELSVRGPRFEKGTFPIRSSVLPTGWTSHSTRPCWHQLVSYRRNDCFLFSPQRGWELRQWEIPNGGLIDSRDKPFPSNFKIIYSVVLFITKYGVSLRQHSSIIDINLSHSYDKTFGQIITRQEKCVYIILRRVRLTIVAMNNQGMLRILSVCL